MLILVSRKHIEEGTPGQCETCPIALGIIAAGFQNVEVNEDFISIDGVSFYHTPETIEFMHNFDKHGKGCPFMFDLEMAAA